MCPSASSPPTDIGFDFTHEELFMLLERMRRGSPLPGNVFADVNPYNYRPSNLPDGIWYLIHSKENKDTELGLWKVKGETCKLFSNSVIIGWTTTFEFYEGKVPYEHKTDWVMEEYWITRKEPCENSEAKGARLLRKVFLGGEKGPNPEKQQTMAIADIARGTPIRSTQSTVLNSDTCTRQGSISKPGVDEEDGTGTLAPTGRLPTHPVENVSEIDYFSRGDYLELHDLDNPASPSSSSENSSCLSMSSDERFDSLALMQELEPESNQDSVQKDAGCKFSVCASLRPNEVVMLPAPSGSLGSIRGSNLPTEEIAKLDCSIPGSTFGHLELDDNILTHAVGNQKADYRGEGSSSNSRYMSTSSSSPTSSGSQTTAPDDEKKTVVGRMKKLKKKSLLHAILSCLFISHV